MTLTILIFILSSLEYEDFLGTEGIQTVCDVLRILEVNDIRRSMALGIVYATVPIVIYIFLMRFKCHFITSSYCILIAVWFYCFVIKYRNCLWF